MNYKILLLFSLDSRDLKPLISLNTHMKNHLFSVFIGFSPLSHDEKEWERGTGRGHK
jgi:hypothetical protein